MKIKSNTIDRRFTTSLHNVITNHTFLLKNEEKIRLFCFNMYKITKIETTSKCLPRSTEIQVVCQLQCLKKKAYVEWFFEVFLCYFSVLHMRYFKVLIDDMLEN